MNDVGRGLREGDRVRLRDDPGRSGTLRAGRLERNGTLRVQVEFPDGKQYIPEDELELVPAAPDHPLDQFRQGKFSTVEDLRQALVRVRLTGQLASMLYSLESTNTDFYAHQFRPVVKLLQSPVMGILIADEVGLGKTIEAGLIWTELRSRFDAKRLLVVCPSFLRQKWQDELRNRFGVTADVVGSRELAEKLRKASPADAFALVGSLQGLRPPRGWDEDPEDPSGDLARLLVERETGDPLFDLVVIDEAHYLRNPESQTAKLGQMLRRVADHLVLLSATPVHLKSEDLFNLLKLIDEDTFHSVTTFDEILRANAPLIDARARVLSAHPCGTDELAALLQRAAATDILRDNRQLRALLADPPGASELARPDGRAAIAHRIESVNLLGYAVTRTLKRDLQENRVLREPHDEAVAMSAIEAEFYEAVTQAVRKACAASPKGQGFLLVTPQRQMSSSMPAALRSWQRDVQGDAGLSWEDFGEDQEGQPTRLNSAVAGLAKRMSFEELRASDSKYARLKDVLVRFLSSHPSEKVVLFSFFRETLAYLHERLTADRVSSILLRGGDDRDAVLAKFAAKDGPRVLLSSEVGSEGIDLQFCRVLVNYDLPWNPMRLEQRIGRLDRLGQKAKRIDIWNLLYADTIDARIYEKLSRRLSVAGASLGTLEPILAEEVQTLAWDLLSRDLSPAQEVARIEQTAQALANRARAEEELEKEAVHLVQYGDYILEQIRAARELSRRVTGIDVRDFVLGFLRTHFTGCEFEVAETDGERVEVTLSTEAKFALHEFIRAQAPGRQTALTRSDPRPVSCAFTANVAVSSRGGVECISQVHPLVRFVSAALKEAPTESHRPAVAFRIDRRALEQAGRKPLQPGEYAFSVQLWSVEGLQRVDELHFEGASIPTGSAVSPEEIERTLMIASRSGRLWQGLERQVVERSVEIINSVCLANSERAFEAFDADIRTANADRADIIATSLERHRKTQVGKYEDIAAKHDREGRKGLAAAARRKVKQIHDSVDRKLLKNQKQKARSSISEIAVGVFLVDG